MKSFPRTALRDSAQEGAHRTLEHDAADAEFFRTCTRARFCICSVLEFVFVCLLEVISVKCASRLEGAHQGT